MSELRDLYQEVILDHCKSPRNFCPLADSNRSAEGYNPLCGDQIRVFLRLDGDRVDAATFQGTGCAICVASASMMTEAVEGRSAKEAEALFKDFQDLVTRPTPGPSGKAGEDEERLGKLQVFAGVREFPIRVKCATLAWHTLRAALKNDKNEVSTESG